MLHLFNAFMSEGFWEKHNGGSTIFGCQRLMMLKKSKINNFEFKVKKYNCYSSGVDFLVVVCPWFLMRCTYLYTPK